MYTIIVQQNQHIHQLCNSTLGYTKRIVTRENREKERERKRERERERERERDVECIHV